ncbi:uncharacterized protein C1orf115 homolog [Tachysurus fulvidraco]|uniref:uncharacterized protein C1orf115 homolog n=1 Tax=Tachysurus fulvidraco TaxID=1234273 RepID=UPI001FEFDA99|nr:uncharacterized protein C1orf115 homolog [Tachysurus fulvidraco]XP_027027774.2 uncharacterized protein C1orf115 homolog [Tachysurus fulvidraco]
MPRKKLSKSKQKFKNKKNDTSKIIHCVEEESIGTMRKEFPEKPHVCERDTHKQKCAKSTGRKQKTSKQVHFAVMPDKYEPLEEDTDENLKKNREKHKRFRKNVSKALRFTWKCLVVGLQSFSKSYSGPLSVATTLVPEIQRTRPKA